MGPRPGSGAAGGVIVAGGHGASVDDTLCDEGVVRVPGLRLPG